jgi:hypothetical protein
MAHSKAIAELRGVNLMPDNDQWTNRFQIRSESSSRLYTVAQNKSNGRFACSCMGWIRHRTCKHLNTLRPVLSQVERLK